MLASGPLLLLGSVKIVQGILGYASPEALAAATGKTVDEYDIDFAEWAGRKGQFLVTVIPGVNLPLSQIWYYLVAVALAALVHEGGHAVAATVERIPLHSFGFFVFLMYPGAYVNLDSNALHMLHPFRQLRVICAGAWHNIVLFIVSYLLLNSLPVTMKWGYTTVGEVAGGLVVSKVEQGSPLYGHILPGSVVAKIGDSKIWDEASWEDALRHSLKNRSSVMVPYCVPQPEIDGNTLDCCNVTYEHPLSDTQYQCFWSRDLLDKWDRDHPWTAAHAGDLARRPNDTSWFRYSSTLVNSMGTVDRGQATGDLAKPAKGQAACASLHSLRAGGILCGDGRTNCSEFNGACMAPFIPNPHVRLLSIWVEDEPTKRKLGKAGGAQAEKASETRQLREVMFLGDPREVWEAVAVGTLFPKYAVLPVTLPTAIEMFLQWVNPCQWLP